MLTMDYAVLFFSFHSLDENQEFVERKMHNMYDKNNGWIKASKNEIKVDLLARCKHRELNHFFFGIFWDFGFLAW